MSSFYGLEIGKTGLFTSKTALNLVGHNIANANTEGYTRQRVIAASIDPYVHNARFALHTKDTVGGGVNIQLIDQVRNHFVDREIRKEGSQFGKYATRSEELLYIESFMNEGTDQSISKSLADFFDSLSEFQKDPVNQEIRVVVQVNAQKLTETFNHYHRQLTEAQRLHNDSMKTTVKNINDLAESIALYNRQIVSYELSGERANDLRDKRNLLLDELSAQVNMTYEEQENGSVTIFTQDGTELVKFKDFKQLEARPTRTCDVTGEDELFDIYWEGTNVELEYSAGVLEGYRSLRDGDSMDNIGIPYIVQQLDELARSLAKEINAIHQKGWSMPNGSSPSKQGILFFDDLDDGVSGSQYDKITAKNFAISDAIKESPFHLAASSEEIDFNAPVDKRSNNKIALELLELTSSVVVPGIGNFENYLKSIVVGVGTETAQSKKMTETQAVVVMNLESRRQSISGVSTDEEMINMVQYNHAYTAASRVITAVDEQLEVLINRMGLVGR